jgi:L-amino acid N-acyltransferase YncA
MSSAATAAPIVRASRESDVPRVAAIYAYHVLNGLGSFETFPPEDREIARRRGDVLGRGLPFVVAEIAGTIVGFAYAAPYRLRAAYRNTLEDSVYADHESVGRGVGRALLEHLIDECAALGYRQLIAVIGDSGNRGSIALHERCGFSRVGLLPSVGYKFGRWVDGVLMQRALGDGDRTPPVLEEWERA